MLTLSELIAAIDAASEPSPKLGEELSLAFGQAVTDPTASASNAQSMIPMGWQVRSLSRTDQGWRCSLSSDDYPNAIEARAATEAFAICKASLLANQFEMTGDLCD